jgi:drug/metabolite transporter (DMT)-like permease
MLPIALGLAAAACVGFGDFSAGVASRRLAPILVGFWAQGTALVLGGLLLLFMRPPLVAGQAPWGLAAGLATGVGLALLYRAMSVGAIALVAPITACSVVFPVVYAIAGGEAVTPLTVFGIVAIIAGVVLASLQPGPVRDDLVRAADRRAVALAIVAAVAFGAFFIMIDVAPQAGGWGTLWTAGAARLSAFAVQVGLVLLGPRRLSGPGRYAPHVAAAGALDQASLVLLGVGAMTDAYGVVTVLMGLYPVITALLGVILLGERLTRMQTSGVTLALAGVMLVSA